MYLELAEQKAEKAASGGIVETNAPKTTGSRRTRTCKGLFSESMLIAGSIYGDRRQDEVWCMDDYHQQAVNQLK